MVFMFKKLLFIFIFVNFCFINNFAEQNILVYNGSGNYNIAYSVSVDDDYIYVVGQTDEEIGFYDALIMKLDKNLNVINKTIYGGVGTYDYFYSVTHDSNNIYATGSSNGQILTIKFDKNLNIINKTVYGVSSNIGYSITVDSDYVYVVGEIFGVIGTTRDNNGILKYDKNLNLINETVYGSSTDHENAEDVEVDDNFVYVLGETYGDVEGAMNWLFLKLDKNLSKNKSIALAHSYLNNDNPQDMIIDGDYIYSVGDGFPTGTYRDIFIIKMDKNFTIINQTQTTHTNHANGRSIISDSEYIYVLGEERPDILIMKLDKNLKIINKTVFSGGSYDERAYSIGQDSSFLYIVGETEAISSGFSDILIIKLPKDLHSNLANDSSPSQFTYRASNSSYSLVSLSIATSSRTYMSASLSYGLSNLNYTESNLSLLYYNLDFYYQTLVSSLDYSSEFPISSFISQYLVILSLVFWFILFNN